MKAWRLNHYPHGMEAEDDGQYVLIYQLPDWVVADYIEAKPKKAKPAIVLPRMDDEEG